MEDLVVRVHAATATATHKLVEFWLCNGGSKFSVLIVMMCGMLLAFVSAVLSETLRL